MDNPLFMVSKDSSSLERNYKPLGNYIVTELAELCVIFKYKALHEVESFCIFNSNAFNTWFRLMVERKFQILYVILSTMEKEA